MSDEDLYNTCDPRFGLHMITDNVPLKHVLALGISVDLCKSLDYIRYISDLSVVTLHI